jgi:hypothetical protein
MKLKNPTEFKVQITINGDTKHIEPGGEIFVDASFGQKWLETHPFLISGDAPAVEEPVTVAEVEEKIVAIKKGKK